MKRVEISEISVFEGRPKCPPFLRGAELMAVLQTGQAFTGEELVGKMGVDRRTLRRDIKELRAVGFEIEVARRGENSYRLVRGDKMPPLVFTDDELELLAYVLGYFYTEDEELRGRVGALKRRIENLTPWNAVGRVEAASRKGIQEGITVWYAAKAAREKEAG
ncbi:helix-turn-helix transcriptional regulator [Corynebacterium meitnerae]|uniref:HTH domain-containing protein n=1 Tax=Corynebacterium meitnerae TaxID=2913498 RepID=A0A9X3LXP3_9CORY|nr:HTH domain-containing protein [Corynebacterium meitnerae]MCZ9294683.1 HTH domain-containing protein [Corynebacterium meitnerae]